MKIPVVELSDCTLCGVCEEVAPSVFRIVDAGFVVIADLSSYPEIEVEEAIKNCPTGCIYWDETDV
jgi:ferredoxin